jgi:hypothetical protein
MLCLLGMLNASVNIYIYIYIYIYIWGFIKPIWIGYRSIGRFQQPRSGSVVLQKSLRKRVGIHGYPLHERSRSLDLQRMQSVLSMQL